MTFRKFLSDPGDVPEPEVRVPRRWYDCIPASEFREISFGGILCSVPAPQTQKSKAIESQFEIQFYILMESIKMHTSAFLDSKEPSHYHALIQ